MITIKGYTNNEIEYLKENFAKYTNKQLAEQLKKTESSIKNAANKLGLIKQPHKTWTKEDDEFLIAHYIEMTSQEIGKKLGRTVHSINARRDDLGLVRNPNWTDSEIQYLIDNHKTSTYEEIGRMLNRTAQAVDAKCFEMGLCKMDPLWTEKDLEFLKNNYMTIQTSELAELLNRTPIAIKIKADRIGLKKYPYCCNYHYFDCIDTEEKAYWLGFITADGWVTKNENSGAGAVGIELQYKDINHLKKFNKAINGNYKITDRWKSCPLSDPGKKNHMCVIRIFSIVMVESLLTHGITPRKTLNISMPQIPQGLQRHFIRGFFDGDGCFSVSNNRIGVRFCTASEKFKEDIIDILSQNGIEMKDYSENHENYNAVYYPEATSNEMRLKLLEYMYKDCKVYLDRKYKKYIKALRILNDKGHTL